MSEIAEEFAASLSDLTVNSKPHINMLTMLADDNLEFAPIITQTVLSHLQKVRPEVKLPVLYLIDSIVKNVGKAYIDLFTQSLVHHFTNTFEKVDEKTREQMFKLRQTWSDVFSAKTMYALDTKVQQVDPAWPCSPPPNTVHLNPKFFMHDILESKSLTSAIKQPESSRSRHKKSKTSSRDQARTSSRSRKTAAPASSAMTDTAKPALAPEVLREQMIIKQKMLLEVQQQKLKLELLQTQAQLEEQQKALERNSVGSKNSSELSKIQKTIAEEEDKLKTMSRNLKKEMAMKLAVRSASTVRSASKLQQIRKVANELKAQQVSDISKATLGVSDILLKPAALLELGKEDLSIKPSKPSVVANPAAALSLPKENKSKIVYLQSMERQNLVSAADSTEDGHPPVRIAPVSSQLINAALSFGRNVRDPRIRQMSSRLESQLNSVTTTAPKSFPTPHHPHPSLQTNRSEPAKSNMESKPYSKSRKDKDKDKRFSSHNNRDRAPRSAEQVSKETKHSKSSRSSDRSSNSKSSSKSEKSSPSKKSDEKNDKKMKAEDSFPLSAKSVSAKRDPRLNSPSKSHTKKDNISVPVAESVPKSHQENTHKIESSPKLGKAQEILPTNSSNHSINTNSTKLSPKSSIDNKLTQSIKQPVSPRAKVSPEPLDSSVEMLDEDIENIVKNPSGITKLSDNNSQIGESHESSKSSDDSNEYRLDEIVKHPVKSTKFDDISKTSDNKPNRVKPISCPINIDDKNNKPDPRTEHVASLHTTDSLSKLAANDTKDDNKKELVEERYIPQPTSSHDEGKDINCAPTENQNIIEQPVADLNDQVSKLSDQEEVSSTVNFTPGSEFEIESYITEEVVVSETPESEFEEYVPSNIGDKMASLFDFPKSAEMSTSEEIAPKIETSETDHLPISKTVKQFFLSPKRTRSPVKCLESTDIVKESIENDVKPVSEFSSPKKEKRKDSPPEKRARKGEKPSIMEQIIADAEKHESSPSPPPPPVISDKFKEIKQSSLSRLRRVVRARDSDSESPEPADVDLRPPIQPPPLTKDLKNEVLGLAEKDVDLRNLPASPTKKRPSMEKPLDVPPAKKSKAEVMDELFGSEDVDLRPRLCPPPPSPPPPPIISSPPSESVSERPWARYKQTKPDTYKAKYTPSRRDSRAPSNDRYGTPRINRFSSFEGGSVNKGRDIDMRAQLQPQSTDGSYNRIIIQALEQHNRGDLNADDYKRVLSEVFTMREKRQLEEAQRRDEEAAQAEQLGSLSDDNVSGGSLSGVEDAPSPSSSYSGGEEPEKSSIKNSTEKRKLERQVADSLADIDIRVDIRRGKDYNQVRMEVDGAGQEELPRKSRGSSPFTRRSDIDKKKFSSRSSRDEIRARRERRTRERREEGRDARYPRGSRYGEEPWDSVSEETARPPPGENMDVDPPRVPPLTHYDNPAMRPPGPGPWEPQRMVGPNSPWMPGMAGPPGMRGPLGPGMGMRPQDRFMPPRWRHHGPGPIYDNEPGPRFNRFGPMAMGRFPPPVCEVPPTDPAVLKLIEEDPTKSINIDGLPRDIRFYGLIAVALMAWDDPREVSFQPGHRQVRVDDATLVVHFNTPPQELMIDGKPHRVRFGAPTRELYIDNQWYEVFFGGSPVACDIAGKTHSVQLEGPPPPVRPGVQRKDLVVGKITLIIDAEYLFNVYLDAKPQKFEVKGVPYIIRFVEALQKTVINGVAFKSDFGGLPRPIILNGSKHFFRLTALPRGVNPGFLTIVNMEGGRLPSPPAMPAPPNLPAALEPAVDFKSQPAEPFLQPPVSLLTATPRLSPDPINVEVSTTSIPPAMPLSVNSVPPTTIQPTPQLPPVNPVDMLTTMMPTGEPVHASDYSYSVDNENSSHAIQPPSTATSSATGTGEINVTELLQKLMATGIVPTQDQPRDKAQEKPVTTDAASLIKPVDFRKPDTLKVRQSALISHLYSGIQCNSCGVRFPPEQTMKYSQHLDWHFRQNRRDKDSSRTAQTRRYYYDVNDWVQFEEIEDLEERAQPWFEMQEGGGAAGADEEEPLIAQVSVRAANYADDATCDICHDKFESFYNEEKEEWQLRNAQDHDGKLVHPLCLDDQKAAAEKPIVVDDIDITEDEPPKEEDNKEGPKEKPLTKEEDDDIMEVTDIEFIKPVFPVEDLTVSDSESVVDKNEEKPDLVEDVKEDEEEKDLVELSKVEDPLAEEIEVNVNDEPKENEEMEQEAESVEEATKDEDSQQDLVLVERGEDSTPSDAEIMQVVRNIKKDPDALGGEYEDTLDSGVKKEKGEVPLPAPVVDTTHTSVTCLIDGNVEFDDTPQQINVGGPPKIKINITKPVVQIASKEIKDKEVDAAVVEETSEVEGDQSSNLAATLALVTQPPPPGEEPIPQYVKPRLLGKKLQELPPVLKGSELSGLCSIM